MTRRALAFPALALLCGACTTSFPAGLPGGDAIPGDVIAEDAHAQLDEGLSDADAAPDALVVDAAPDALVVDAAPDAVVVDAARLDAVVVDAARLDAVVVDAARLDAVVVDAAPDARPDALVVDAAPDALVVIVDSALDAAPDALVVIVDAAPDAIIVAGPDIFIVDAFAGDAITGTSCEDLMNCDETNQVCHEGENAGEAYCGECRLGHVPTAGSSFCRRLTCEDIDRVCDQLNRVCNDSGVYAFCEDCIEGFEFISDNECAPVSCEELGCPQALRSCETTETGAHYCGDCVDGYINRGTESEFSCQRIVCDDLLCEEDYRDCVVSEEIASCGGCSGLYLEIEGLCVERTCENLGCAGQHRECLPGDPHAACSEGCIDPYRQIDGICYALTCEILNCGGLHRDCNRADPHDSCGGCQDGYREEDGRCEERGCARGVQASVYSLEERPLLPLLELMPWFFCFLVVRRLRRAHRT